MQTFKIKRPSDWEEVAHGDILEIKSPSGARNLKQTINATGPVDVYIADMDENGELQNQVLVGTSQYGMFAIEVGVMGTRYITYALAEGVKAYILGETADQRRMPTEMPKFTSLEPQGRRNSDLDRMMQYVKLNEKRREATLSAEIKALRAEQEAALRAAKEAEQVTEEPTGTTEGTTDETSAPSDPAPTA